MKRRTWILWSLFAVTAAATVTANLSGSSPADARTSARGGPSVKTSPADAGPRAVQPGSVGHVELELLGRNTGKHGDGKSVENAFNASSWHVAPPPPPPPPPAEPVAPPLPFSYLGRYQDMSKMVVILTKADRVYTVSEGEVIDGTYRVEQIADDAVNLVYLPMKITQSLSTVAVPENAPPRPSPGERYRRP